MNYPEGVYPSDFDQLKTGQRFIQLDDMLETPINVSGFDLDAKVSVTLVDSQGGLEIDSVTIGDVYIWVNDMQIKLDQEYFVNTMRGLYSEFCEKIEEMAIQAAKFAPDACWVDDDCED